MKDVLAVVLAGGRGERLGPLTRDRAKPAVPFGGIYRIIDFTLSNCLNSGVRRILVLTQYKAMSLDRHITLGWRNYLCRELGEFIDVVPPQQRIDEKWYQGTADAVYQNIYTLEKERPEHVVILAGDHIYKMDYAKLIAFHQEKNADLSIAALRVPAKESRHYGIMQIDASGRIVGFEEKPAIPKTIPGNPEYALASMGIYVFGTDFLIEQLTRDAADADSNHDFGRNILPGAIESHAVQAYSFRDASGDAQGYWRDVGAVDSYWQANMELIEVEPELNLYDKDWPIWTYQEQLPPAKFVFDDADRRGFALNSMVAGGCIVAGASIRRSVLFSNVHVEPHSDVDESVVLPNVRIGKSCRIRRTILDKGCVVPDHLVIGHDRDRDSRLFHMTPGGITLVTPDMLGQALHTSE